MARLSQSDRRAVRHQGIMSCAGGRLWPASVRPGCHSFVSKALSSSCCCDGQGQSRLKPQSAGFARAKLLLNGLPRQERVAAEQPERFSSRFPAAQQPWVLPQLPESLLHTGKDRTQDGLSGFRIAIGVPQTPASCAISLDFFNTVQRILCTCASSNLWHGNCLLVRPQ